MTVRTKCYPKLIGDENIKNLHTFIKNGLLLSAVSLILRTVGVFFNAYITRKIGAVGTGMFSLITSVVTPALTLTTAGVNLAVSRLVAEENERENGVTPNFVIGKSICYCLTVSLSVSALLFIFSDYISVSWLGNIECSNLIKALSLALPFASLSSAFTGYFVAVRRVSRNAAVALFEQVFKIGITVFALSHLAEATPESCLAAVIICSVFTDAVSCFLSCFLCKKDIKKHCGNKSRNENGIFRNLLSIVVPVSVSSFLRSGLIALEHILIPKGLRKNGSTYEAAMSSYGVLGGMAMPIIMFPASFLYSFTGLLIPELAEARADSDNKQIIDTAKSVIKTVLIFSVGAAGIIFGFSYSLGTAVYSSVSAAKYIMIMAPLIPVMYLDTAVDSILKGIGEQVWTMKINIIDAALSVVSVWLLVPRFGLYGYIAVIFISEIINFAFSIGRLITVTGLDIQLFSMSAGPLLAVIASTAVSRILLGFLAFLPRETVLYTVTGVSLSIMIYLCILVSAGIIPKEVLHKISFTKSKKIVSDSGE